MTAPTSTYYCKAFCVECLTDRNRTAVDARLGRW